MAWRQERSRALERLQDIVKHTLGVDHIELRYSWSAQNNTVMFLSLMKFIEPLYVQLKLPWTGMTLVFSADDCTELPVSTFLSCHNVHFVKPFYAFALPHNSSFSMYILRITNPTPSLSRWTQ
jgi:hypothetical protein